MREVLAGYTQHGVGLPRFHRIIQALRVVLERSTRHPQRKFVFAQQQPQQHSEEASARYARREYRHACKVCFQGLAHMKGRAAPGAGVVGVFYRGQ